MNLVDLWILRAAFILSAAALTARMQPFGSGPIAGAGFGLIVGALIVLVEMRLRQVSLRRLVGAAIGMLIGVAVASLAAVVLRSAVGPETSAPLQVVALLLGCYVGVAVGGAKGEMLNLGALSVFRNDEPSDDPDKILDTSVIIDGRIADVAETGFLDGVLIVPQFVLWELQLVADSADSVKRNRGRRGLDILQKLQKQPGVDIEIVEKDYPELKEVDQKLLELAKEIGGKIVTNDFNLNKLAGVQGVPVLNLNELANTLKPVVLPGEIMKVFILKEGKEYNQGVAYLDDGTMVVVDNARDQISKTVDVTVTSVLQTTAGKMIFGRYGSDSGPAAASQSADRRRGSSGSTRSVASPRSSQLTES